MFTFSALLMIMGIATWGIIDTRVVNNSSFRFILVFLELSFPLTLSTGLYIMNGEWPEGWRRLFKTLIATGLAAAVSIPVILVIGENQKFSDLLKNQINVIIQAFNRSVSQAGGGEGALAAEVADTKGIILFLKELTFRSYLFVIFLFLIFNWRGGTYIVEKLNRRKVDRVINFFMPEKMIWPLLVSWAGIFIDRFLDLGLLGYAFWNVGSIFLVLYALQGIGILKYLFNRYNFSRLTRVFIGLALVIMLFWPGVNLLVIVGIPALGVSELWIKYRKL